MRRIQSILAAAILVVACGGSDSTGGPGEVSAPAPESGSAASEAMEGAQGMAQEAGKAATEAATEAAAGMMPEGSAECLDLVKQGQFAKAVPVCTSAVAADPDNAEVQQALGTAQQKAAAAQATEALGGGTEEAASELESAKEGVMGGLPK